MKVSLTQYRIIRVLTMALVVTALAASTASAVPAPPDSQGNGEFVLEPTTVVQTVDDGFDWDSAAIGAGGAGALLLLVSLGGFTYRSRHHHVGISH